MYSRGSVRGRRAIYEKTKANVEFSMSPTRLGEAESNPFFFRASTATFNVLGRDPDMRRDVLQRYEPQEAPRRATGYSVMQVD